MIRKGFRAFMRRCRGVFWCIVAALALCILAPVPVGSKQEPKRGFSVMTYNIWDLGGKRPAVKDVAAVISVE